MGYKRAAACKDCVRFGLQGMSAPSISLMVIIRKILATQVL